MRQTFPESRMPAVRRPAAYAALALLLGGPALRADDAVLRDGRTVAGQLLRDDRGRLHFTAGGRSIPAGQIERVRFAVQGTPYRAPALHQAFFRSGERLTGELLRFDGQTLRLRTAWKDELAIPRHALAGVTHFADQVVFFVEDFEKKPSAWQLAG